MWQFRFPDISRWQGVIDWDTLKAHAAENDIQAVLIKAGGSDGGFYTDSQFTRNVAEARRVGLPAAFYFFKGDGNPVELANALLASIDSFQPGEFIILDDENEAKVNPIWDAEFCKAIKSGVKFMPPVYSNLGRFQGVDLTPLKELYALAHVASYGTNNGQPQALPAGIDLPAIAWQYTSTARIPGITANTVDMNIFFGTIEDWKKLGTNTTVEPKPPVAVAAAPEPAPGNGTYTVVSGDSLSGIGAKLGTDWRTLAATNGIVAPYTIFPGQILKTYGGSLGQTQAVAEVQAGAYIVVSGDNLSGIGVKTGHDWREIAALNGISSPFVIYPGQRLSLPGGAVTLAAHAQANYTVQSGDTLSGIAGRLSKNWQTIANANNISAPYVIYPNQVLIIP